MKIKRMHQRTVQLPPKASAAAFFDQLAQCNSSHTSRSPNQLGAALARDAARFQQPQPAAADWNDIAARCVSESGFFIITPS